MKSKRMTFLLVVLVLIGLLASACDAQAGFGDDSNNKAENKDNSQITTALNNDGNDTGDDTGSNDEGDSSNEQDSDSQGEDTDGDTIKLEGVVEAVSEYSITVNGQVYEVDPSLLPEGTTLLDLFTVGDIIEIEYIVNPDGSITIISFELSGLESESDDEDSDEATSDDSSNNSDDNNNSNDDNTNNNNENNNNNDDPNENDSPDNSDG